MHKRILKAFYLAAYLLSCAASADIIAGMWMGSWSRKWAICSMNTKYADCRPSLISPIPRARIDTLGGKEPPSPPDIRVVCDWKEGYSYSKLIPFFAPIGRVDCWIV